MKAKDILISPIITEKTSSGIEGGRYAFLVPFFVTKLQVKGAIEETFGVKVTKVWSIRGVGKKHRVGNTRKVTQKSDRKKILVQLKKGDKIEILEEKK